MWVMQILVDCRPHGRSGLAKVPAAQRADLRQADLQQVSLQIAATLGQMPFGLLAPALCLQARQPEHRIG